MLLLTQTYNPRLARHTDLTVKLKKVSLINPKPRKPPAAAVNVVLWYLVHAQVISERQVLVSVPANVCDGVGSLALTEEITRRKLR